MLVGFYSIIGIAAILLSLFLIKQSFLNDEKKIAQPGTQQDNKFGIVAGESVGCETTIVTLGSGESISSYEIYGDKVVYHKNLSDGTYGIYSYDLTTGVETLIIDNASNPEYSEPSIYDNKIALYGYIPYYNIYLYQNGSISQLTTTTSRKSNPYIFNDKIVYRDWSYGMNLFDITTSEITNIDTGGNTYGSYPKMYENYVVWHKYDGEVYITVLYDISTGVTVNISEGGGSTRFPDVYNNYIAYYKQIGSDWQVALYNILNEQETIITDPNLSQNDPFQTVRYGYPLTFNDNYVAWSYNLYQTSPSFWGVKVYNTQTQQEYVLAHDEGVQMYTPKISGNNVVFLAYDQFERFYSLRSYSLDCLTSATTCSIDQRQACGSYTTGACQTGYKTCGYNNAWSECQGNIDPVEEICNDSIDNDCDGSTDEEDCTDAEDENEGICPVKYIKVDYGRYSFDHGGGSRVYEIDALDADDVDWADYTQGSTVEVSSINTGYASEGQYNFDARDIIDGQFGSTESGTFVFDYYDNDQWAKITLPEEKEIQTITTSQIAYDIDREVWENIIIQTSTDGTNWITWYENLDAYNTPTSVEVDNPNNCGEDDGCLDEDEDGDCDDDCEGEDQQGDCDDQGDDNDDQGDTGGGGGGGSNDQGDDNSKDEDTTTTDNIIEEAAYFEFSDSWDDLFVIKLTDSNLIQEARNILNNVQTDATHVNGIIIKEPVNYNPSWSFHYDPSTIEFFENAMEVCDASIAYVEEYLDEVGGALLPDNRWCPWSSELTRELYYCTDSTLYGQCSTTLPSFCHEGNLLDRCQTCGCEKNYICSSVGRCVIDEDDQGEDEDVNDETVNNSLPGYGSSNGGSADTTTYIIIKDKRKGIEIKVKEEEQEIIDEEKELVEEVDQTITSKYAGRIILPEDMDEIWYVEPVSEQKFYLNDGNSAYNVMQIFGLGISNDDLAKIPIGILDDVEIVDSDGDGLDDKLEESLGTDMFNPDTDNDGYLDGTEVKYSYHPKAIGKFPYEFDFGEHLAGKILIQVESRGEAWYVNPDDGKRYYLKDGYTAYQLLNMLSSQVSTDDLRKIEVGEF